MISRRAFLKSAATAMLGMMLTGRRSAASGDCRPATAPPEWTQGPDVRMGRAALPWRVSVLARPHMHGKLVRHLDFDEAVTIVRDVVGLGLRPHNHVWNELEDGYAYSAYLQPVYNRPNQPLRAVPPGGLWGEVTIPYTDGRIRPDPKAKRLFRLYYSIVLKIIGVETGADDRPWYALTDETGMRLYAPATAFRPITAAEIEPLAPEIDPAEKRVVVNLTEQSLSAFEGKREVFRTRISSGALFFGEDGQTITSSTPIGERAIWQKRISRHMQGGTLEAGYDLPGIGWVCYFGSNGAALHSTYWHNDFGAPKSHGCLNCRPEDAKWLFRWTLPATPYDPGNITVNWANRGTIVEVRLE